MKQMKKDYFIKYLKMIKQMRNLNKKLINYLQLILKQNKKKQDIIQNNTNNFQLKIVNQVVILQICVNE